MSETYHAEPRDKRLPPGNWVRFSNLPNGYTDEQLAQFLSDHGLCTGPERVSIRQNPRGAEAFVSFEHDILPMLVAWVIGEEKLKGRKLVITTVSSPRERNFIPGCEMDFR